MPPRTRSAATVFIRRCLPDDGPARTTNGLRRVALLPQHCACYVQSNVAQEPARDLGNRSPLAAATCAPRGRRTVCRDTPLVGFSFGGVKSVSDRRLLAAHPFCQRHCWRQRRGTVCSTEMLFNSPHSLAGLPSKRRWQDGHATIQSGNQRCHCLCHRALAVTPVLPSAIEA